ncbi:MAG: Gfo/Idh/MocA family oxidoreductase [Phycisphaerae bacterium]|nr:Gfo/Idh/MocA family oxidoreductase [Phycisphaerae bacterium]
MDVLKVGILGLSNEGQLLLEAASELDYFELTAIADKDSVLAERLGNKYSCKWYDDYRQFVTQNQFDCLIVAEAFYACKEYIKTAINNKTHILKTAPLAPDFESANLLSRCAKRAEISFAVVNPARFDKGFARLKQLIEQEKFRQAYLVTAFVEVDQKLIASWQEDKKLAGGGVLLRNCYQVVDQLINNFGMPQEVYSFNTNRAEDHKQRVFRTEDTSVVMMKFSETLCANVAATSVFGEGNEIFNVYSKESAVKIDKSNFVLKDVFGKIIENIERISDISLLYSDIMKSFALSIIKPEENPLCSSIDENIRNMAVIESVYLSSRTAMPESPHRVMEIRP